MAYTVRSGENLTRIARSLGTTVDELVRLNGISNPDLIFPGQELVVPGGGGEAVPAAAAPSAAPSSGRSNPPSSVEAQRAKGRSTFGAIETNFRGSGQQQMGPRAGDGDKTPVPLPREPPGRSVASAMVDVGMPAPEEMSGTDGSSAPPAPAAPQRYPNTPGPPAERGAPMQVGRDIPGYQPEGWLPVPGGEADTAPTPVAAAMAAPDLWQGRQGDAYAAQTQRRGPVGMSNNDIPDFTNMTLQQMLEFETQWMSAGRRVEDLGPDFERVKYIKRQQMEADAIAHGVNPAAVGAR